MTESAEKNFPAYSHLPFDSDNNTMEKRVRDVTLKLIGANFNRRNEYWLILEDAQTETGYQKYPVIIDLAFQDDFF